MNTGTGLAPIKTGVCLENIHLAREGIPVLHGISLELTEQRIGLVGDNGSGKSSLVRLFNGLLHPTSGRIQVNGVDPAVGAEAMANRVGFIFQNPDHQLIFPTVIEELGFGLRNLGRSGKEAEQAALAILARYDRQHWAKRPVHSLSDGQKQLVCILAVLLMEPELLVLDEPFSALDRPTRQALLALIATLPQQVVMISHDLETLAGFTRIIWLENGRVRRDGGSEVLAAYREHHLGAAEC